MENKIASLKDIRRQIRGMDPEDGKFEEQFMALSSQAMNCMEGINDGQEKNWIEKGREIIDGDKGNSSSGPRDRDRALSYLKEAVNNVILREDKYRE